MTASTLELPTIAAAEPERQSVKFHLSLNVANLDASVDFFRVFLGRDAAKCRADYAKFEIDDPPVVLSLEPFKAAPGGNLNHLGFRMPDSASLVEVQRRLELAGISTRHEEGVECCYARQTKFWVHDPDGNLWEVYTLDEDLEHRGDARLPVDSAADSASAGGAPPAIWAHRLGEAFAARLPILDGTVDRVMLQGTFNERLPADQLARRLTEVRRVLKPGGIVHAHLLTSDRPAGDQAIRLPGPAAAVQVVLQESEVFAALAAAGFVDAKTVFRAQSACFTVGGCEFRETRIEASAS